MGDSRPSSQTLRLEPVSGPQTPTATIGSGKPAIIGRAVGSDVCLLHEGVSRRHAQLECRGNRWFVSDLGSSPGTFINGMRLHADAPTALGELDLLRIGPWTFRVVLSGSGSRLPVARTMDDSGQSTLTISSAALDGGGGAKDAASQRLNQLIDCTARVMDAPDPGAMARVVLEAAVAGTGFHRGAIVRTDADGAQVEVVAGVGFSEKDWREGGEGLQFSRTLIREAAAGKVVTLADRSMQMVSERTVNELGIHSAFCAPVLVGTSVVSLLYLDARGGEAAVRTDGASFCAALARTYGMALGSAMRMEMDARRAALESELGAAREAQQLIMPPPDGVVCGVKYAVRSVPGRFVAGDLFDVVELPDHRVAVTIGDVSGEGAGSAMLMAGTQAYLHGALKRGVDLGAAVNDLNQYVTDHSPLDRFVSLWVGVFDATNGTLEYVDAGHGHWLLVRVRPNAAARIEKREQADGIPLGIQPDCDFPVKRIVLDPGDRVVLYSDGLLEQSSPEREEFGPDRIAKVLAGSNNPEADAASLMRAVQVHAGRPFLDDDTTIASVRIEA